MDKNSKYTRLLKLQISTLQKENRCPEFKSNHQAPDKLGEYISALSNGACLDKQDFGYLYFGVEDGTLAIKGTTFEPAKTKVGNQDLELYLRQNINPKIDFTIEEFFYEDRLPIIVFKIPAAVNEPTCFIKTPYIRVNSSVTRLTQYTDWTRAIYNSRIDWTAQIVESATLDDLDSEAILLAKKGYAERFPQYAKDMAQWDDDVFLDRARLTIGGQITRGTLLLLGKTDRSYLLGHNAQLVWKCFQDGQTFGDIYTIPFITSTTKLLQRIRNYRFKIYPPNSLIPAEVWKYDNESILEAMHNCIAHQDYQKDERIVVTEDKDCITFENAGSFYDGNYQDYILGEKTPKRYRNAFLANAMVNVKMIDTQGYGIHKLFVRQKERYLPMPDYSRSTASNVVLKLPGTIIDEKYSLLLMANQNITLTDVVLLDQVQKGIKISKDAARMLKEKSYIEGRYPNVFVAKLLSQSVGQKVQYTRHKGLDKAPCEALLLNALHEHGSLSKREIENLLIDILSDQMSYSQKKTKIDNILRGLRQSGKIINRSSGKSSHWFLNEE